MEKVPASNTFEGRVLFSNMKSHLQGNCLCVHVWNVCFLNKITWHIWHQWQIQRTYDILPLAWVIRLRRQVLMIVGHHSGPSLTGYTLFFFQWCCTAISYSQLFSVSRSLKNKLPDGENRHCSPGEYLSLLPTPGLKSSASWHSTPFFPGPPLLFRHPPNQYWWNVI